MARWADMRAQLPNIGARADNSCRRGLPPAPRPPEADHSPRSMAGDLTTSRDSAFGSCELDLDAAIVPAEVFASPKKFGTVARCDSSVRHMGVRFQPYTAKEKRQWLLGGADRGFLRLYDPSSKLKGSIVLPCDLRTTARQICVKLSLPVDSLHYQLSGEIVRRIAPGECPLSIQNDFLIAIGYDDPAKREQLGDSVSFGFLLRFFVGKWRAP